MKFIIFIENGIENIAAADKVIGDEMVYGSYLNFFEGEFLLYEV